MSLYDKELYNHVISINEAWNNASYQKLLMDCIEYIKDQETLDSTYDHTLLLIQTFFPYLEFGEIAKFLSNDVLSDEMKKEKLRYVIAEYLNSEFEGEVKPESLKNEYSVPVLNTTFDIDLDDTDINIGNNLERMLYVQVDLVNYQYIYALDTEIVSSEQVSLDQMIDEFQSMTFGDLYEHALNVVYPKAIEQYNSINYIKSISENEAAKIFNSEHGGKYDYLGKFIIKENDGYTAIDNSTGDAWTEEFNNKADAIRYLNNEYQNELDKVSSSIEVGDLIRIENMEGEPSYALKEGIVKRIDDLGQIHGTWGGLAVDLKSDSITLIQKNILDKRLKIMDRYENHLKMFQSEVKEAAAKKESEEKAVGSNRTSKEEVR